MTQTFESLDAMQLAPRISSFISQAIKRPIHCTVSFNEDYLCSHFDGESRLTNDEVKDVYNCLSHPSEDHLEINVSSECNTVPDLGEEFTLDILREAMELNQDTEIGIFHGRILIRLC